MQNSKVLPVVGLIMVLGAVTVSYAVPRLPVPQSQRLPIETFPRMVGDWKAGEDMPVHPEVRRQLTTATIVTRNYQETSGQSIELTLLTATRRADFHNPNECFPGQGWELSNHRREEIAGQRFNTMAASKDGSKLIAYYCWMGERDVQQPSYPFQRTMLDIRDRVFTGVMDRADGMSLFLRVIGPDSENGRRSAEAFITQILPQVRTILAQGV